MKPGISSSLAYPLRGLGYLASHRELWKYAAGAFAVNFVVLTSMIVAVFAFRTAWVELLTPEETPEWIQSVLGCFLVLVAVLMALFVSTILGNLIAGPFLDAMTERMLVGLGVALPPSRGVLNAVARSIVNQLAKLLFFGSIQVFLLVLLITPAGFLQPPLAFVFTLLFLGFEYLDYPLDARRMPVPQRFSYLFGHLGPAAGFGAACFAVHLVPFLGYLALPASVCGATLLSFELDRHVQEK